MANNKDFKVKNGIQPTSYFEGVGTVVESGGVATLDLSTGSVFDYTPTSDVQVTLSNPADSGTSSGATLVLTGGASSNGYDLGNAAYTSKSFSVASQDTNPQDIIFNDDGTKMYLVGDSSKSVHQYSLSTAYDISTASYDSVSLNVSAHDGSPTAAKFNSNGTRLFVAGQGNGIIIQYLLSTAYDLSTATYDKFLSVISYEGTPCGIAFSNNGLTLFVVGYSSDNVLQYTLSTAYELSGVSFTRSRSVSSQTTNPLDIEFNTDGTKMYIHDFNGSQILQYSLGSAFNIDFLTYDNVSFSSTSESSQTSGIAFNGDGTNLYFISYGNDAIYQYSTASPATITYDPNLQWSAGTAPTAPAIGETDVITFNTTDGGTTYTAVQAIDGAS